MSVSGGRIGIAAALLLALSIPSARADFLTGEQLLAFCRADAEIQKAICSAYTVGAADMLIDLGPRLDKTKTACIPKGTSSAKLVQAVAARAAAHPAETKQSASALVYTALASTWPCPAANGQ